MSIARVVEITSTSDQSFEDALQQAVARATRTLRNVRSAWVKEQEVGIENGEIVTFKVNVLDTFVLDENNSEMDEDETAEDNRKSKAPREVSGSARKGRGRR